MQNSEGIPQVGYFLRDNVIFRDGVAIGENTPDGLVMYEGFENYRLQAQRIINQFEEDKVLPPAAPATPAAESKNECPRIETVTQLVEAMQPFIAEPCPPKTPWLGDETPEIKKWIADHDDIRVAVLKQHNS